MQGVSDSFVIHPIMRELGRFLHKTGSRVASSRWDLWAQCLIRRNTRMLSKFRALVLTLVGRRAFGYLINERWKVLSQRFYPQIRLAIQLTPGKGSSDISIRLTTHNGSHSKGTSEREPVVRSISSHHIFRRLRHVSEFMRTRRQSELMNQNVRIFLQRVAERTQRVEEPRIAAPLALVTRQSTALAAHQSLALRESRKATASGVRGTRGKGLGTSIHNMPGSQPLNIEALTDQVVQQIDRRMTAWRERMGKI
jgi:hypothetical protein